jgi:hypothetical protein
VAPLRASILGDTVRGLFYTGQSVTRIPERAIDELRSAQELIEDLDATVGSHAPATASAWVAQATP